MFPTAVYIFSPCHGKARIYSWYGGGLGPSKGTRRSCGESERVVKVLTEFSEATDISSGRRSGA